ncbi:hypothetical protein BDR26DRAFT_865732 [Obelidium mucronatum]|nr:hypothetical protein BDR26DRAFT_865732 [Obelidium mucronatum]
MKLVQQWTLAGLLAGVVHAATSTSSAGVWCDSKAENFCMSWIPQTVNSIKGVQITLSSPVAYYIGVGIGGTDMPNTKLYIVHLSSTGTPILSIRKGMKDDLDPSFTPPANDAVIVPTPAEAILCGTCKNNATAITATFWRPLSVTTDPLDVAISPTTNYIWATAHLMPVSNPDDLATVDYHPHTLQSTVKLDMTVIPPPPSNSSLTGPSTASFTSPSNDFSITATRDPTTQFVTISLQSTAQGYISVGLGASTMAGSNMYVGWINAGKVVLSQRTAAGHVTPTVVSAPLDATNAVPTIPSTVPVLTGAKITFSFAIPVSQISTTGPTTFIYGLSNSPPSTPADAASSIAQHGGSQYGSFSLDLTKSGKTEGSTSPSKIDTRLFKLIHGICMFLAWGVFPFLGVFVARYMKAKLGHTWYIIHLCSMIGGCLLLSIAGMVVIELTVTGGQRFITTPHGILGTVITFGFLPLQTALGFIANHLFSPERERVPWWDQMHWWVGRLVILAALVNCYLGITAYSEAGVVWVGVYIGWVVVMFVVLGVGQYVFGGASHHVKGNKDFELHDKRSYDNFDGRGDLRTPDRLLRKGAGNDLEQQQQQRQRVGAGVGGKAVVPAPTRPGYTSPFDLANNREEQKKMGASGRGDASAAFRQGRNNTGGSNSGDSPRIPVRNAAGGGGGGSRPDNFGSGPRAGEYGSGPRRGDSAGNRGDYYNGPPRNPNAAGAGNSGVRTPDGRSRPGANAASPVNARANSLPRGDQRGANGSGGRGGGGGRDRSNERYGGNEGQRRR